MTRAGWLVHAEQEARDAAERAGLDLDYLPDRDEAPERAPAASDGLMERIREGAALAHEQRRCEEHWREAMRGRV